MSTKWQSPVIIYLGTDQPIPPSPKTEKPKWKELENVLGQFEKEIEKVGKLWEKFSIPTTSPWFWLACGLGLWWVSILLVDSFNFIENRFSNSFLLGLFFLGLFSVIVVSLGRLVWTAWQDFLALKNVSTLQTEGAQLLVSKDCGQAIPYFKKITHLYAHNPNIKERVERFYMMVNNSHLDSEVCTLFSKQVLNELDEKANRLILKQSTETALLVALSPKAFLSTLLTLWNTVKMIRDLATLYGGRPGFISSISLIGKVFQSLIYAGISEQVANSLSDILGGSLLSVVSTQLAQGMGSGILTARVGLHAMKVCRPLPFRAVEQPQWQSIAREIWSSFKTSDPSFHNQKTV